MDRRVVISDEVVGVHPIGEPCVELVRRLDGQCLDAQASAIVSRVIQDGDDPVDTGQPGPPVAAHDEDVTVPPP
jgi:hypothetical protein